MIVSPGTLPGGVSVPCDTLNVASSRSPAAASTSLTVPLGAISVTAVFWLVVTDPDTALITGASLTAVMLMVVVATVVLLSCPSLTTQLMLRLASVPKLVGLWLLGERDRFQRRLILRQRRRPGERQHPAAVEPADAVLVSKVENIASQKAAADRHRRTGQRR